MEFDASAIYSALWDETCTIYRPNRAKDSTSNRTTYSVVATNIQCNLLTTPNVDKSAGGFASLKESNIFTDNKLHIFPTQEIRAGDVVKMTTTVLTANRSWFRVVGDPQTRANYSQVYLSPHSGLTSNQIV